jgi:hypothetical protein
MGGLQMEDEKQSFVVGKGIQSFSKIMPSKGKITILSRR